MISVFGIVSLVVAVVALYALYLHSRLMKVRTAVDNALGNLDDALYEENDIDPEELVQSFNNAVDDYNKYIENFPGKIMAAMVGFKKERYYEFD